MISQHIIQPGGAVDVVRNEHFAYNANGLLTATVSFAGGETRQTSIEYETSEGIFPSAFIDAIGHVDSVEYFPSFGMLVRTRDPNGVDRSFQYDGFGRLAATHGGGEPDVTVHYDGSLRAMAISSQSSTGAFVRVALDQLGREVASQSNAFDGRLTEMDVAYDDAFPGLSARVTGKITTVIRGTDLIAPRFLPVEPSSGPTIFLGP